MLQHMHYFHTQAAPFSCLEHIINLMTQALLEQHSKSKYYDPALPDADLHVEHSVK